MSDEKDKVTIRPDLSKYVSSKTAAGKPSKHSGDAVATAFSGLTLDDKYTIANRILPDTTLDSLKEKYAHLNAGMQGMNLAGRIRAVIRKANKAEEGSGDAAFEKASAKIVQKAAREAEKAQEAKEKAAAERAAKKEKAE